MTTLGQSLFSLTRLSPLCFYFLIIHLLGIGWTVSHYNSRQAVWVYVLYTPVLYVYVCLHVCEK